MATVAESGDDTSHFTWKNSEHSLLDFFIFGPGIHISSSRETDGNDSFVTSDRLFKALKDEDRGSLRSIVAEDDDIKFTVLASNMPICIDPLTQMASEAISPPVDETLVSPTGAAGTDLDTSV